MAQADDFLSVTALAEHEGVPVDFLRKIMQKLNAAGIVESRQGPFGGYALARNPETITFLEVVETIQGRVAVNECFRRPGFCPNDNSCRFRSKLAKLQDHIDNWLGAASLAGVVECIREGEVEAHARQADSAD